MSQHENILKRFFDKVLINIGTEHDIWTGSISSSGHGLFYLDENIKHIGAHVFAYEYYNGVEAIGDVHHTCNIKACIRKEHLVDLSRSAHMLEHHKFCKRGHDLSGNGQTKSGKCRECQKNYNKKNRHLYPTYK